MTIFSGPRPRFRLMFRQPDDLGLKTGMRNMAAFSIQIPLPSQVLHATHAHTLGKAEMPSFLEALPTFNTLSELAEALQLSEFELKRYCLRNKSCYHSFERKKKSGNGTRRIDAPTNELKATQRLIKTIILDKVELHSASTGYRAGMSIVDNASRHVGQSCVLNMDIQSFFQSINTSRVAAMFASFGYNEEIAIVLAKLCCFNNALPQGAPSSPAIANVICNRLDRRLHGFAKAMGMNYSRYCDDITISGGKRIGASIIDMIGKILLDEGFSVNEEKTRVLSRRSSQTVTGLTVNEKVNIPRRKRKLIRAIIHQAQAAAEHESSTLSASNEGVTGKAFADSNLDAKTGLHRHEYVLGLQAFVNMVRKQKPREVR